MNNAAYYTRIAYGFEAMLCEDPGLTLWDQRSLPTLQRLARRVWRDEGRSGHCPPIRAHPNDSNRCSCFLPEPREIYLRHDQMCKVILLHEMAHALATRGHDHGNAFKRTYLMLLIKYSGDDPLRIVNTAVASGAFR